MNIKMFGEYGIYEKKKKINLKSKKAEKILYYLILNNKRAVSFREIARVFFDGYEEIYVKKNLNTLLYMIRKGLKTDKSDLKLENNLIFLSTDKISCDFLKFQKYFENVLNNKDFNKILELYSGELLEGLKDEWVEPYRKLCEMQVLFLLKGFNHSLESIEGFYSDEQMHGLNEIDIKFALKLISLNNSRRVMMYFPIIIKTSQKINDKIRKSDLFVRLSLDTYLILFEVGKTIKKVLKESLLKRFENDISFIKVFWQL